MHSLLARYHTPDGRFDELHADGAPRTHWRPVLGELDRIDPAELRERWEYVSRQIQENGVTYNVYADPKGDNRPWDLDLLPQLIPADEWARLAAGVAQRARLLDRVVADLYGPQTLLKEGLLPPDLIYGHNNYLWPAQGMRPRGDTWLHVYAADLARAPDGRWWVIADRTQAPSGAGYALENRHIVAGAFPELYRQLGIRRLEGWFAALRDRLSELAADDEGAPLTVLLTPGRYNETYFEHAYLARQLGCPLVEGQDLTVRAGSVYLKTLGGLKRVHAILRRLDDDWCDPLELRGDSAIGVPGLLDAARAGRVLIANALGTGVLESPGLLGFIPAIAERWLGEPLQLPSVATWWCGEEPVMRDALRRLEELVIKPAFPSQRFEPVFGASLSRSALRELKARIRRRPHAYVAQELVRLSQAPIWDREGSDQLVARAISMRVYAVATAEGYRVLPGGLTRVAGRSDAQVVSMQRGGGSKDTWVYAGPGLSPDLVRSPRIDRVVRHDPYLLSRTVENLYWLGRYCERCDGHARLLRSLLTRHMEADADAPAFSAGLAIAQGLGVLPIRSEVEDALLVAITEAQWATSLHADLRRLCWSAAQVRARLSMENWRAIMELQREAGQLDGAPMTRARASSFLNRLLIATTAMSGFALDDMVRDDSWRFLMVGRSVERLQFQAAVLAAALRLPGTLDLRTLAWLLELGNSTITYRTRYLASPQLMPVLDLLLLDDSNPHALGFQLDRLLDTLTRLGADLPACEALAALPGALRGLNLQPLIDDGVGARLPLCALLEQATATLRALSEQLMLRHFAHVDAVSQSTLST
ncbi:MAG: circularly permuted type 2 ATP-grasp protein [Lysobacterales bacterium]